MQLYPLLESQKKMIVVNEIKPLRLILFMYYNS
jgi:hypothetical protein